MTIYIMRFGVFTSVVSSLLHSRTNISGAGKFGSLFLKGFLLHIIIQIAIQIMFLMLICVRYQAEVGAGDYNPMQRDMDDDDQDDGGGPDNMATSGGISRFLKVMISGGLLLPLFSLPLYFVSAQKPCRRVPHQLLPGLPHRTESHQQQQSSGHHQTEDGVPSLPQLQHIALWGDFESPTASLQSTSGGDLCLLYTLPHELLHMLLISICH